MNKNKGKLYLARTGVIIILLSTLYAAVTQHHITALIFSGLGIAYVYIYTSLIKDYEKNTR